MVNPGTATTCLVIIRYPELILKTPCHASLDMFLRLKRGQKGLSDDICQTTIQPINLLEAILLNGLEA
eukprot:2420016-Amphidinium_carterae.1